MRILIVEDDWLIAQDHVKLVESSGHEAVGPAPSVRAATAQLGQSSVDGALLDVRLAGGTSYAIADELRARGIPFVFLTGCTTEDIDSRFNGVRVLSKPVSEPQLAEAIASFAASR